MRVGPNHASELHLVSDATTAWHRACDERDPRFDGVFFVGITSTRIYCRPICPSLRARPDRRRFFRDTADAEAEAAAARADQVFVTDDNPRSEDPAVIRRAVLAGCPGALEIGDRRAAIRAAVAGLDTGDVLLVAGKGHESGQIVGDRVLLPPSLKTPGC